MLKKVRNLNLKLIAILIFTLRTQTLNQLKHLLKCNNHEKSVHLKFTTLVLKTTFKIKAVFLKCDSDIDSPGSCHSFDTIMTTALISFQVFSTRVFLLHNKVQ